MKRISFLFTAIITLFAFYTTVWAASGSLSVSSDSVCVGDSFTTTVSISNAASWNVHVASTGPVSG